jgi:hypothetical protein
MTSPVITTLPTSGRYIVDTLHSTYSIDVDRCVLTRTPMHDEAATLRSDDAPLWLQQVHCVVGEPMRLELMVEPLGGAFYRTTTPVLGITPDNA